VINGGGIPGTLGISADPRSNAGTGGTGVTSTDSNTTAHIHHGTLGDSDAGGGGIDFFILLVYPFVYCVEQKGYIKRVCTSWSRTIPTPHQLIPTNVLPERLLCSRGACGSRYWRWR